MRQFILSLLLTHLAACSGMQTIPLQEIQRPGENSPLQIGDRVEVVTRDNEKLDFAVTDITTEGVAGKFGFIPYQHIRRLSVHRPGHRNDNNLAWLWGLLGVAAVVALISSADSVTVCSGTPCPQPQTH